MTTEEYIEQLRNESGCDKDGWDTFLSEAGFRQFQESLNPEPPPTHPARSHVEERIKEIQQMSPTELADRDMARIVDLVKEHLTSAELSKVHGIRFAQLWTSSLDALATRSPSGDRIILVNRGCLVSSAYSSIALSDYCLNTDYSKAGAFMREDVQLFVGALDALVCGTIIPNGWNITEIQTKILLADQHKTAFADMLTIGILCFVVAHELGHHILGHEGHVRPSRVTVGGKPIEFFWYSRQNEFAADKLAWEIFRRVQAEMSLKAHIGEPFYMSKYSVLAPLLLTILIESAQTIASAAHVTKAMKSDTHPSGYERRRALEPLVLASLDDETMRFAVWTNHFLYKAIPAFFKGYLPEELSVFICAPLFDFVE